MVWLRRRAYAGIRSNHRLQLGHDRWQGIVGELEPMVIMLQAEPGSPGFYYEPNTFLASGVCDW